MSDWKTPEEILARIAADRHERLTDEQRVEVDDVLEAAAAYRRGELPLTEFANVGTIGRPVSGVPSAAYSRFVAVTSTPPSDERRADLLAAIDDLLAFQGFIVTKAGMFEPDELREA